MQNHLISSTLIGFIPSSNLTVSKTFYSNKLKLNLVHSDEYALEYRVHNAFIRVAKVSSCVKAHHTILGWAVSDIEACVEQLIQASVIFNFYEGMPQDANGICTFPNGSKVAWFKDPDENVLSISQS